MTPSDAQKRPVVALNNKDASTHNLSLLKALLAFLRAQHWLYWTHHWTVEGDGYYGDHLLFDRLYSGDLVLEIDTLAEKMVARYGEGAVDPLESMTTALKWLASTRGINCPFKRSLHTEEAFQRIVKIVYNSLKEANDLSLGMDDFLMSMASRHETAQYLLQQRLKGHEMDRSRLIQAAWENPSYREHILPMVRQADHRARVAAGVPLRERVRGKKRDPEQVYAQHRSRVESQLKELQRILSRHGRGEKINWGHIGDMAHVSETLESLLTSFREGSYPLR